MNDENLEIGGSWVEYVIEGKTKDGWSFLGTTSPAIFKEDVAQLQDYSKCRYSAYRIVKVTTTRELVELT